MIRYTSKSVHPTSSPKNVPLSSLSIYSHSESALTVSEHSPENNDAAEDDTAANDTAANERAAAAAEKYSPRGNPMETPTRAIRPHGIEGARKIAAEAARVAIENNGSDVLVLDISGQSAEFDFFVIATGTSRRQLHAISEQIDDALEKGMGDQRMGIEGYQESSWIVLDYGSLVVHLFDEDTREYYDLESLWADGTVIPLQDLGLTPN